MPKKLSKSDDKKYVAKDPFDGSIMELEPDPAVSPDLFLLSVSEPCGSSTSSTPSRWDGATWTS